MIGYIEEDYIVIDKFEKIHNNKKVILEIRREDQSEEKLKEKQKYLERFNIKEKIKIEKKEGYISIIILNEKNKEIRDILFKYEIGCKKDLMHDWIKIKENPYIKIKDMKCEFWIEGHGTGFYKSGAVIMF